eukprot:GEZU01000511.1.p1 GENE.GEZU01000511.1~~GEZU01000511.1.p1  ORF type:complete len:204 (+),score=27.18 GEZU01000511.1:56-613(+)
MIQSIKKSIAETVQAIKDISWLKVAYQVVSLFLVICSALIIWKTLIVVTQSDSPVVVVLSGSMEPGFYRGDLLFLTMNPNEPYRVGDIVVFKIEGRDIPIVHRILRLHEKPDGSVDMLTKGDANNVDDRGLYARGQLWLNSKHIVGRAKGFMPYVGMLTIVMNDYPYLKFALIGVLGLLVLLNKD